MKGSFTPDEEMVMLFLRKHANSTESQIAEHTGLKQRDAVKRALDGLAAKGMLRHTDDADERYSRVHSG
jgi:DNA-binding MarR family transcriptional regulator